MCRKDITAEVLFLYKNMGLYQSQVADILKCSRHLIIRRSKKLGVEFKHNRVKHTVNEAFFYEWSHDLAYTVGFLMADGCIRKPKLNKSAVLQVSLQQGDIEVLNYLRGKLCPTKEIKFSERLNKSDKISYVATLSFTLSDALYLRFLEIGLISKKSGFEIIPDSMPPEFYWSFILGYFDGDGSISKRKNYNLYDFSIVSASKNLILDIHHKIRGSKYREIVKGGNTLSVVSLRVQSLIRDLRVKLYEKVSFSMGRKRERMFKV